MSGSLPATTVDRMLLDDIMPTWDATRMEHRVVDGARDDVFDAALALDFLDVPREVAVVRALFGVRTMTERMVQRARREAPPASADPSTMRLADLPDQGEWVRLGVAPGVECAFGAVGRFWAGRTEWRPVDADTFVRFDQPGYARIGCNLSFRDYGPRCLVSYEARTHATDDATRAAFLRYWRAVDPFVGVVMRATLRLLDRTVSGQTAEA
jgi:hypothetical protein